MRGTLGFLLLAAGVWLLYLVVTGRWASMSSTPTSTATGPANTNQGIESAPGFGSPNASQLAKGSGPGPDVAASPGGMQPLPGGISTHTPGSLPTMQEFYGTTQGRFV